MENKEQLIIPTVNLTVIKHNGKPAIEIRKVITDLEAIKNIVSSAYHDKQILINPNFTNKALSINRLIETGLIHQENNQYHWVF